MYFRKINFTKTILKQYLKNKNQIFYIKEIINYQIVILINKQIYLNKYYN